MAEVLAHYASTSHLISLRLARANSLREIGQAAQGMTELVRTLHAQGAKMSYLMELISALNRRVMAKIFEFVVPSAMRSEEHTSELQSLMRISYAVFCLKKKKQIT